MDPAIFLLFIPLLLGRRSSGSSSSSSLGGHYPPGSVEQVQLFLEASKVAGTPTSWIIDSEGKPNSAMVTLLTKESGGWVGRPNYEFGEVYKIQNQAYWPGVWSNLHAGGKPPKGRGATGLGQLVLTSVDKHYPDGRKGIGNPMSEAVGMLSYLNARWKSPERAIECHKAGSCFCNTTYTSSGVEICADGGIGIKGYGPKRWDGY